MTKEPYCYDKRALSLSKTSPIAVKNELCFYDKGIHTFATTACMYICIDSIQTHSVLREHILY